MLYVTGAGRSRGGRVGSDIDEKTRFTSRFVLRFEEEAPSLEFVTSFAVLAEAFSTVFLPDFGTWQGVNLTALFQNLSGALMGGLANQLQRRGGTIERISAAFGGGFVAAFTSFAGMVENAAQLGANGSTLAVPYLLTSFVLGPASFTLGQRVGRGFFPAPVRREREVGPADPSVRRAKFIVWAAIAVCFLQQSRRGAAAVVELTVGVIAIALSCLAGEPVGFVTEELYSGHASNVNWATWVANATALLMATWLHAIRRVGVISGRLPRLVLAKAIGTFCGGISAFGAFSEDVSQQLREKEPDGAMANFCANLCAALTYKSLLVPLFRTPCSLL